ncbi:MAG: Crp/Fnr family transcriptional regulator [Bacteroidota bacterium]
MDNTINKLDFTQKLMQAFQESSETKRYSKGQFLTVEGKVERRLFYIVDGAVKIYYLSESGEKIIRLGYNGSILNSLSSFFNQQPSELYIESIRATKVKILSRDAVLEIVKNSEGYANFLERVLVQQLDREIDLLLDSPIQRLERVLERSPNLFQHVPLKYIASYLRMSPETLSRIRNS